MTDKRFRLTDMELDEISLVPDGDDPSAQVVLAKAAPRSQFDITKAKARIAMAKIRHQRNKA